MSEAPISKQAWAATLEWLNSRGEAPDPHHVILANLAEDFERERDEANQSLEETEIARRNLAGLYAAAIQANQELRARVEKVERERDEARRLFESSKGARKSLNAALDKALEMVNQSNSERDQLRARIAELEGAL